MASHTVYIFYFSDDGSVTRIPYAKWKRISSGKESVKAFANASIRIAHAYILLENKNLIIARVLKVAFIILISPAGLF